MKEESIRDFFAQVGKFHHLVVTAGETPMGGFVTTSVEAAKAVFDSKFWGQYMSAKIAAPSIAEGGSITFFSGSFSRRPASGAAALAATNAAVEGLTRALAVELSPLRVNCIAPGLVVTPMYDGMDKTSRDEMFAQVGASLPAKRVGQPEDIAETALYLMKSRFTTGTVVQIDGGALLA
ncbi:MAG: SDR family oxidoreductase [Alicyclobacillaceae bacterium]|nr:SDR family oxidoreductase [Alicyclobacillaceae bacterium]